MKIRIKFSKKGPVKFIGHLDTMRFFQKLVRRAGIPVAYSEGYSPHQKMSFAQALGVGAESEGEYFDLEIREDAAGDIYTDRIIKDMNAVSVEGIEVTGCVILPEGSKNAMASVYAADYLVTVRDGYVCPFDIKNAVDTFNQSASVKIIKKTKKTEKELELKELVYILESRDNGLFMRISASSSSSIKPALILEHFCDINSTEYDPLSFMITRLEIYDENMKGLLESGTPVNK